MNPEAERWLSCRCLEVTQPIGTFYIAVMNSNDLIRISYSDVRRIGMEQRAVETYLGIERPLNNKRVAQIKEYVNTLDSTFPSSVILAVSSGDTKYDEKSRMLQIKNNEEVGKVLDGQHRIAGLEGYKGPTFEVVVTLFVDADMENQAMIFATINLEQTKVNKSLVYDLFEYAKRRSPQKTAHNIVKLLDKENESPLKGKVKILGTAGNPQETLSQALICGEIIPLISNTANQDRDLIKRHKDVPRATSAEERTLIFRNMFIDERDADIARILWNYFGAVQQKWGEYWSKPKTGFVLNKTTGFSGLMMFLPYAYLNIVKPGEVPSQEQFSQIFARIQLTGNEITPENFAPGRTGQVRLRDMLLSQASLE